MLIHNRRLNPLFYWLLALSYLLASQFYSYPLQAIHKAAPIIILAIVSLILSRGRLRIWLTLALAASSMGDILLATNIKNSFLFGLMFFAVAHVCYASGFFPWAKWSKKKLAYATPLAAVLLLVLILVLPQTGELAIAVLFYISIISAMAVLAIFSKTHQHYLLIGAYLFVISDSLIAINKFVIAIPAQHLFIMLTYYLAQYFLFTGCIKQNNASA
jgi:uncharacterized membrane protein YhhN